MKIGFDAALGPHAEALKLRSERTEVLARNIAHADTPGYLARDIDFRTELARRLDGAAEAGAQTAHGRVRTTHERHLPIKPAASDTVTLKYRTPLMPAFDGNTVDTQTEQAAFAENNMQFQAALQFVNSKLKGLLGAIKGE